MAKNNQNEKERINALNKILNWIQKEEVQNIFMWLILAFGVFSIISLIGGGGFVGYKLKMNFWLPIFGLAGSVLFNLFLVFVSIRKLQQKISLREFVGFFVLLIIISIASELFLEDNSYLHFLAKKLKVYFGVWGSLALFFVALFFALWSISEEEITKILLKNEKKTETLVKEDKGTQTPLKGMKTVVKGETPKETELKPRKILMKSDWHFPPIDLLSQKKEEVVAPDIKTTSQLIKKTFENFGISVEIGEVEIGPMVTRFAIRPAQGIKLSKILSLQNDLSLALGVPNLRIETPIPGKSMLGIEVPNITPAIVRLGNLVREGKFLQSPSLLTFPIGRKINGEAIFGDLAKMPHILIAGTTGSGKSMFIHTMLLSFLLRNSPETLNLILIDPKRVELVHYQDLPHLLLDPILDSKKALGAFHWLVEEMQKRYEILEAARARDIDKYNEKSKNIMPRIVLVIDELADLMVSHGSTVETYIVRLTQMARATGIHLILATQRPSVDVVTGLIKANIPNRLCLKVASQVDSRTVLDISGAEKLIGSGDALFISNNLVRPVRVQTPFVSEKEIEAVVDFWAKEKERLPEFEKKEINLEEVIMKKYEDASEEEEDEFLFKKALEIVVTEGKASTSLLQRRLKIGYARAARILDLMEKRGIVGPQEGSKPRKVLVGPEVLKDFSQDA
jgi:DNA segregation ATPase FtsK/SpoIIIE, S-DNA-T family